MPRSMKMGTFECKNCHAIAEVQIETVEKRGPGFKCSACSWWTWLPEDEGVRGQLSWMAEMDLLAQEELGARPRSEVIVEVERP